MLVGVKQARSRRKEWCIANINLVKKCTSSPGDAVAVHLAEHAGVAHVHLRLGGTCKAPALTTRAPAGCTLAAHGSTGSEACYQYQSGGAYQV